MRFDFSVLGDALRKAVFEIAGMARDAGGRALVVGGAVRDLALGGIAVKDIDIEIYGIGAERLKELVGSRFGFHACGVSFGVLKLKDFDIDISLPRRESKRGEGHRAFLVRSDPDLTVSEAASRRDFTINAMYCDPLSGELIDPYGGLSDLSSGVLRHVSEKFCEDPLRVLRGMQFVARFGLVPAPETVEVCRRMDIEGLAAERLYEEWAKLLKKGVSISSGLDFLRETGWTIHFPGLRELAEDECSWNATLVALDAFAGQRLGNGTDDLTTGFAVLCRAMPDPVEFLRRITDESRLLAQVPRLVCAMPSAAAIAKSAVDGDVRRLALKVGRIDLLVRTMRAYGENCAADLLESRAKELGVFSMPPEPIFKGRHLVEMGLRPDRRFGEWLQHVFEAQLDGKVVDLASAQKFFRELASDSHD